MRPTVHEQYLAMASVVAARATCARRSVGCILANIHGEVLSTGYNGRQRGAPHCNEGHEHVCAGASMVSGIGLDECEALHAEWNALLQCRDPHSIARCYVTTAPCITCTKMLLNTGCDSIYYVNPYPSSGEKLWVGAGRTWVPYVRGVGSRWLEDVLVTLRVIPPAQVDPVGVILSP